MQTVTDALVIRERSIDESDRLLTLLTADRGVLNAYAKGARRLRGAMTSATELLCYSSFVIASRGDAHFIDKAESETVFFGLRQDVEKLSLATYFCQLCYELVPEQEGGFPLRLMLNTLHLLEKGALPPAQLKAVLELRLLSAEGYMPDLTACGSCGAAPEAELFFSPAEGILYCGGCADGRAGLIPLAPGVFDAMRHIISAEMEKLFAFRLPDESLRELAAVCERYLLCQVERMLPALQFYKTIVQ